MKRSLSAIANEIIKDWSKAKSGIYFGAVPYINAMAQLINPHDKYGEDEGRDVINYFLANAGTWRGETAKRVKAELREMVKR